MNKCRRITRKTPHNEYITPEKLDAFPIPNDSAIVVYDAFKRRAVFYHKICCGKYTQLKVSNKRTRGIDIRKSDYRLTFEFDEELHLGDTMGVMYPKKDKYVRA